MEKPFISVVIPTYNHANLLGNAIRSVANQTYINWEILVVDNHSTDHTDEVLREFDNLPLRVFKINNYGVIAASRNVGIRHAKGEWVSFLDSDDEWTADKLQKCVERINQNVDIIFHDMTIQRKNRKFYHKRLVRGRQLNKPIIQDLLINGNPIVNSTVMVRTGLLLKINGINEDTNMVAAEDYNTWLRLAQVTDGFVYVPEDMGFYTVHDSGMSRKNMSIPMKYATMNFLDVLNNNQLKCYESVLAYADARFLYSNQHYEQAYDKLRFCTRYGNFEIKFKSLYMLLRIAIAKYLP